jgi:hypothetical protein
VIHVAVDAAAHVHPVCTWKVLLPPLAGRVEEVGFSVIEHCDARCVTGIVAVEPPLWIETFPVRGTGNVLGEAATVSEALPTTVAPDAVATLRVIHEGESVE